MSTLADFVVYVWLTVGGFFLALVVAALAAEYVKQHRYDSEWCWRLANWLDSL